MRPEDEGRYQPLPPITGLPAFLWRKLPRAGKIAATALGVAALGAAAVATPQIIDAQRDADARERRGEALRREQRVERLRALVEPRTLHASGPRSRVLGRLRSGIADDARRRTGAPILHTSCARLDALAPGRSARQRGVRFRCLAVTSEFAPGEATVGGSIGYPYRAVADFRTRRITFCRVFGVPGEGGLTSRQLVTVPARCGG